MKIEQRAIPHSVQITIKKKNQMFEEKHQQQASQHDEGADARLLRILLKKQAQNSPLSIVEQFLLQDLQCELSQPKPEEAA